MTPIELVNLAIEAREHSYCPYSHFAVGAALLTKDGKVYQGCNIENVSFSPTNCAERTAFFKAVYDGEREFDAIAIVGGPAGKPVSELCAPCGVCRQVMREFCEDDFKIYLSKGDGTYLEASLIEMLPFGFSESNLQGQI
ncbi:MAG: cytidine deaminase [Oscillospiraceae bacterium]|nr:cytidine deaminase [Oscillospiraceae bacterium]